ncbi:MAG TPA: hypothetical protein VK638_03205 [Edaphobacter sp.]|nr:hypothetical protein [Edaphobacter sp.]
MKLFDWSAGIVEECTGDYALTDFRRSNPDAAAVVYTTARMYLWHLNSHFSSIYS